MASKNDIIFLPAKNLRAPSETVVFPLSNDIKKLIADMKQATLDWETSRPHEFGVALAAVQINIMKRVVVIRSNFKDKSNTEFNVYINPEITRYDGEPEVDYEGCLSVVDVYGKVPRYNKVKVKAKTETGITTKFIAKGFLARVFQHEIDHTKGITFVDRIGAKGNFYKLEETGEMVELTGSVKSKLVKELKAANNGITL